MHRPPNQITERQVENKLLNVPQRAQKNSETLNHKYLWILFKWNHMCLLNFVIYFKKSILITKGIWHAQAISNPFGYFQSIGFSHLQAWKIGKVMFKF